ncbi:MAG: SDR family NAD(P)-dependent oxidoreductase [Proteobacteria bacterium]|nr:SDR family NAD(P)-dependent oxidoreductase [Pseudomonadota bacterium]MBU1741718.1 SDR family NAD(P)-dependent oxidoreductase [Pseudomonadota bacterium]
MSHIQDRNVIITGASSGIGAALARVCSVAGAKVALTARRADRLAAVARDLPGPTLVIPADVTSPQGRRDIARRTLETWGHVDVLVNNAGLGAYGPFLETGPEKWRTLFEVNVFAAVFLTQEVLPSMLARGRGTLVNLASIGGLAAHSDSVTAYVASKHALVGFSRGLARDLAGTGVRVKAACPHLTDTEFFEAGVGAELMRGEVERFRSFMDSPEAVARGIIDRLDDDEVIFFPTEKPARAWAGLRDV